MVGVLIGVYELWFDVVKSFVDFVKEVIGAHK